MQHDNGAVMSTDAEYSKVHCKVGLKITSPPQRGGKAIKSRVASLSLAEQEEECNKSQPLVAAETQLYVCQVLYRICNTTCWKGHVSKQHKQ